MFAILLNLILISYIASSNPIIRDLYGDLNQFQAQLQHWTTHSFSDSSKFSSCADNLLLGGHKRSGKGARAVRTYTDLPSHKSISYRLELWYLDTWDSERINLKFDSLTVNAFSKGNAGSKNLCGRSNPDGFVIAHGKFPHSANMLTLEITSTLDEDSYNESWGVREISLILEQTTVSGSTLCGNDYYMAIPVDSKCKCADSEFLMSSGVCQKCPDQCSSCSGTTGEDCFQCNPSYPGYEACDCPITKMVYQNKCLDACPSGAYSGGNKCIPCPENCESCTATRCLTCKTGFRKITDLICYPVCDTNQKNTLSGTCQKPVENYENLNCLNKLSQGKDDASCQIPKGQNVIFEVNYDKTKHYFTQSQGTLKMLCNGKVNSYVMKNSGCYVATLVMIAKTAGVQKLGESNLDSPQSIASDLTPQITNSACNFLSGNPQKFSEFPYEFYNSFLLFSKNTDFSKGEVGDLAKMYQKELVDRAFGNLIACGNQCAVMMIWRHTKSTGGFVSHATMLTKFETYTTDGSIEEIFKNTKLTFADPGSFQESYRERNTNTFCFDDANKHQRYCLFQLMIYKRKNS